MPFEKKPDELGALWVRSSAKGEYMTGEINGVGVVCFLTHSKNPKAPAWRVMKAKPKADAADQRSPMDPDDF